MKQPEKARSVVDFRPLPSQLVEIIHRAAVASANVMFGSHALERMEERGITTLDALRVLQQGELSGSVEAGRRPGEWKCKMVKKMKGAREIGVVTIVINAGRLFVKTVEWEDL